MEKFEITKAFEDFTTRLKALDKVLNIEKMKQEIKNAIKNNRVFGN